jgi:hypothetical protein
MKSLAGTAGLIHFNWIKLRPERDLSMDWFELLSVACGSATWNRLRVGFLWQLRLWPVAPQPLFITRPGGGIRHQPGPKRHSYLARSD